MKAELKQLIALQNADAKLRQIQVELNSLPQRRADIEKDFDQRAFEFRSIEMQRDEAQAARARLEAEIREIRAQGERAERNLMSSKNEKDYGAAIREVDATRKQVSQLETQILEHMETFERTETAVREREPEITKLRTEKDEKLQSFEEQTKVREQQIIELKAEREQLMASLPKQLIALYTRLSTRIRDGIAVAEARNNSCTACSISLRPHVMSEIRRGEEIIMCDNCSRILYYVPVEQVQPPAVKSDASALSGS